MRNAFTLGALALVMVLLSPGSARAAVDDYPAGTYQETCKNIRMRGDTLYARCKNRDNRWVNTWLRDADRCVGELTNVDGRLVCGRIGSVPSGDYSETCRDIRIRFNTLYARCQTRDGDWVRTSLDGFTRCTGNIANVDGQLRCPMGEYRDADDRGRDWDRDRDRDRDRDGGYGPRGSYRQSCRDIEVHGDTLRARCETEEGQWRETTLNDIDRCVGEIVNDDGRLECTRPGGRTVPTGNYMESCQRVHVDGDTLRAWCPNREGRWIWSQLNDWDDCRGGIWNDDGRLRCRRDRD
jgi:hypothetical protein